MALNSLGELAAETGDAGQARDHHDRALSIAREIGAPPEEARALAGAGRSLLPGRPAEAADHLRRALEIYQRIGAPDAREVRDLLGQLGG